MKFDLHVHTNISACSQLALPDMICQARRNGLSGVCITDHDTMDVRHKLREGIQDNGLCLIFGMEYTTNQGDFLLFGPFEELRPGLPALELLRYVDKVGGVAVAAHPFRENRAIDECLIEQGFCKIVEGINGRNRQDENDRVANWKKRYAVKTVGGSDAHLVEEVGQVVTTFEEPIHNRIELIHALKNGRYKAEKNLFPLFAAGSSASAAFADMR